VAFLNKYAPLYGYSLVAPKQHLENVTGEFSIEEYLALQQVVYRVAEALRRTVPTERLYIPSLGGQQANRHVHWHVGPLPPGIPFEQQQFAALSRPERVVISENEMASLADRLRQALPRPIASVTARLVENAWDREIQSLGLATRRCRSRASPGGRLPTTRPSERH
jgi:diadenosine tetraphosphate (Ap4A) HIT family hydrolase